MRPSMPRIARREQPPPRIPVKPADAEPVARFRGAEPAITEQRPSKPGEVYRDIVAIGASAGGVEALTRIVPMLPPEFPAAIFVVLHLSSTGTSVLPDILARKGSLPATVPRDGEKIHRGHVYVAPPDRHLLLAGSHVHLSAGPRENGHRPAIDPLFRSAARTYGPRVIAVILSGTLDDGAAGARLVKERGGTVVVQSPEDALYPAMPQHAAAVTDVDAVLAARDMAEGLTALLEEPIDQSWEAQAEERDRSEQVAVAAAAHAQNGEPAELSCPECGGPLWERGEGEFVQFACRVGHVYSPESLIAEQGTSLEQALWSATRGLYERADLYRRLARRAEGKSALVERFERRANAAEEHAEAVRDALARLVPVADAGEQA
jgi:two-component system, chemotaxis family, protein-glutamate methylesterase/glutaminase